MEIGGKEGHQFHDEVAEQEPGDRVGLARVGVGLDGHQKQVHEQDQEVDTK